MEMEYLNQNKVRCTRGSFEIKKNVDMDSKLINMVSVIKEIFKIISGMAMVKRQLDKDSQLRGIGLMES